MTEAELVYEINQTKSMIADAVEVDNLERARELQGDLDDLEAELNALQGEEEFDIDLEEDYEYDGQPTLYEEFQDLYGGDDWDHGQYDDYC